MTTTIHISLGGLVFVLEQDAYRELERYFALLTRHYGDTDEGREIVSDIEARIAELIQERIRRQDSVVNLATVLEVIALVGSPVDFDPESQPYTDTTTRDNDVPRKLYRDSDNRYIAGVASGVAHYLGISIRMSRFLFILLHAMWGLGVVIYLILWFFIPEAATATQRLEMKGKPVNLDNIERTIKNEFNSVTRNFKNLPFDLYAHTFGENLRHIIEEIAFASRGIFRGIGILFGILFVLMGLAFLSALIAGVFFHKFGFFDHEGIHQAYLYFINLFVPSVQIPWLVISVVTLIAIPTILEIYGGFKMIFRFRTNDKALYISSVAVWIAGLGLAIWVVSANVERIRERAYNTQTPKIEIAQTDTLNIAANALPEFWHLFDSDFRIDQVQVVRDGNSFKLIGQPQFNIEASSDSTMSIVMERTALGSSQKVALAELSKIKYNWSNPKGSLLLDAYFRLDSTDKWYDQSLRMTIKIPVGKIIYLDPNLGDLIYDIHNQQNMWDGDMMGKYWIMTANGLSLYGRDLEEYLRQNANDNNQQVNDSIIPSTQTVPPDSTDAEFEQLQREQK